MLYLSGGFLADIFKLRPSKPVIRNPSSHDSRLSPTATFIPDTRRQLRSTLALPDIMAAVRSSGSEQ
ncbi:hypothetical protein VTI74DRAFT_9709 [Chaetomium olivicolor]